MTYAEAEAIAKDRHHCQAIFAQEDAALDTAWNGQLPERRAAWMRLASEMRSREEMVETRADEETDDRIVVDLDLDVSVETVAKELFEETWTAPRRDESDERRDALWLALSEDDRRREVQAVLVEDVDMRGVSS